MSKITCHSHIAIIKLGALIAANLLILLIIGNSNSTKYQCVQANQVQRIVILDVVK
jgi:hypothetical protein